jgi:hypothetical protein
MSTFDHLAQSLRDDCDAPALAGAAELRRAADRRTTMHRSIGGAATLAVVAGVTTGVVLLGSSSPGAPKPAASGPAAPVSTVASPQPSAPTSTPPATSHPTSQPSSTPTSTPSSTRTEPATSGVRPCSVDEFDVAHATLISDDASAIIGYDIHVAYRGTSACKLSQPPRVYYTTVTGETLPFAIDNAHSDPRKALPLTVRPGRTVSVTVYGVDGRNDSPVPPGCRADHTYKGLAVSVDGQARGLLNGSMTFPCSGPVSMAWTFA